MRERENKRKANLRKKAERDQREREARARMGIPEPVKGFYVGPSQIRLSGFLGKRTREETEGEEETGDKENTEAARGQGTEQDPRKEDKGEQRLEVFNQEEELETLNRKAPECDTAKSPQIIPSAVPSLQLMAPPKSRAPLRPRSANPIIRPKPLFFADLPKSSVAIEDDWDSFLASNTQIEREIASPKRAPIVSMACSPPARPCIRPIKDEKDILDMISTQDLDYTEEEAPVGVCVPKEELRCDGHVYEAKEVTIKEQLDCNAETTEEPTPEDDPYPESDYGDDIDDFQEPGDTEINLIDFKSPPPFALIEPDEDFCFRDHPSDQAYEDDPVTAKLNSSTYLAHYLANRTSTPLALPLAKTEGSDFDDGIEDEELEDLLADCESTGPQSLAAVLDSFDYGDFELSTQEMRELGT